MIEDRVRAAWAAHGRSLRDAHRALRALGVATASSRAAPRSRSRSASRTATPPRAASTPRASRCPRAARSRGVALGRARERVLARPAGAETASDVEIALTNHLERLARAARAAAHRRAPVAQAPALDDAAAAREAGRERAPRCCSSARCSAATASCSRACAGSATARASSTRSRTPSTPSRRSPSSWCWPTRTSAAREGIELVPALAELPGIERLPVVLVDERSRESVREAARRVGAAGYLAHPVDAGRISAGLDRLLRGRGRRRFARLGQRLDVERDGGDPGFTIAIARLGFSVRTARELREGGIHRWTIRLAELGEDIRVDAQTIYRIPPAGPEDPTAGLRIRSFPDRNEPLWIDYLTALTEPKDDPSR